MISYFLLLNCVALLVLFGSVVCPECTSCTECTTEEDHSISTSARGANGACSNTDDWMAGMKMLHVTLIRRHDDGEQIFDDGYIESAFESDHWHWDFYESHNWDRHSESPKSGAAPTSPFEMEKICKSMQREDEIVIFVVTVGGTNFVGSYTLIFANETDAKNFIGEARANSFEESQLLASYL